MVSTLNKIKEHFRPLKAKSEIQFPCDVVEYSNHTYETVCPDDGHVWTKPAQEMPVQSPKKQQKSILTKYGYPILVNNNSI